MGESCLRWVQKDVLTDHFGDPAQPRNAQFSVKGYAIAVNLKKQVKGRVVPFLQAESNGPSYPNSIHSIHTFRKRIMAMSLSFSVASIRAPHGSRRVRSKA